MSIKLTTQMDWIKKGYAYYSKYHPDNSNRPSLDDLPDPVAGPAPVVSITELDKKLHGAWGHKLSCERPYGPCETTTRIKGDVTTKVGSNWSKTIMCEKGNSTMCSAMYGGSCVERTCCQLANEGVGSIKK